MPNTLVKRRENASSSANVLMCKQWWKVCWMYGDQEKYYRQLYGKQKVEGTATSADLKFSGFPKFPPPPNGLVERFYENSQVIEDSQEPSGVFESLELPEIDG